MADSRFIYRLFVTNKPASKYHFFSHDDNARKAPETAVDQVSHTDLPNSQIRTPVR
jgi:hypothetical protein